MKSFIVITTLILYICMCNYVQCNSERPYYNIAHMTNTKQAVQWAISEGANAVEVDVNFRGSNPISFSHASPCDCICGKGLDSVCQNGGHCGSRAGVEDLLAYIATTNLALLVIDSKIDPVLMNYGTRNEAGENIIKLLDAHLFANGFKGSVVVGVPSNRASNYLAMAIQQTATSNWKNKYYYTIDGESNNIAETIGTLHKLQSSNILYGTGITSCLSNVITGSTATLVRVKVNEGVIGMGYIWTIDSPTLMRRYLYYFQGIMSNKPGVVKDVLAKAGKRLAGVDDVIPTVTTDDNSRYTCDCDYKKGGCKVAIPAPDGTTCKCIYKGFWTCRGEVATCRDSNSPYCKTPDVTIGSCLFGGGDCGGYGASCGCNFIYNKGCKLSKLPPNNVACKCSRAGRACKAEIVRCRNGRSAACKYPTNSKETCLLGGGNCEGY